MSYQDLIAENQEWIDAVLEKLDKKLSRTAVKSRNKLPYTTKTASTTISNIRP